MNRTDECEIVRDLAIPFREDLINEGSKKFVENHLRTCNDCKEYYKDMESKIYNENMEEKDTDNLVLNQFKKIHRHINILKISLIVILISIMVTFSTLFIKYQRVEHIIDKAYSKIEYMKNLDNYKLTVKTIQKNFKTDDYMEHEQNYFYKDGKYKIEDADSIKFYEDNSYEKICVYHNLKTIEYYKQDFIEETKGRIIGLFSEIINYKKLSSTIYNLSLSVREERYNGMDCYVIRFGNNNSYRDTWINKSTFITVRVVNEDYGNFYREEIYTFYENVVNIEDVDTKILNSEKYQNYIKKDIIDDATEETKLYYDILNK